MIISENSSKVNPQFTLDTDSQHFFTLLHRGANGFVLVQNLSAGKDGKQRQSYWFRTDKPITLPQQVIAKGNIFFGINPAIEIVTAADRAKYPDKTDAQIAPMVGTKNHTIAALNALHREYDGKDFTEPTQAAIDAQFEALRADPANAKNTDAALRNQAIGNAKDAEFQRDPATYLALVKAHVDQLTPAPSVVVFSGGGYQCYWLASEPLIIRTHIDDHAAHVQSYAADLQKRWVQLDPKADQGVNDIRRIYRLPGSYNHKKKYAPNFPLVSFYRKAFDLRYNLQGLKTLLPLPVAPQATRTAQRSATANTTTNSTPYEGDSVISAYNAAHTITALLEANGYTAHGDRYMRPGGSDSPGVEVDTATNRSRHWSSNDCLYSVYWRSPFDVFCTFTHSGNMSKAVSAAAVELSMVRTVNTESIKAKLQKCRQWLQTANFAELVPQALQSAKGYRTLATDKRLYSALLDILAQYGRLRGPISNQQLHLASGLSEGSARNATKRLIGACLLAKIDPVDQHNDSGCFWYELRSLDYILSCVPCAVVDVVSEKPYRARYATKVFTDNKTHDAFQRGGSARQRKQATIKAMGSDALIFLDVVSDYGRQTQTAIAERTHQSKYTVSRIVKRLLEHGIITVEAEGTRRYVSLSSDWLNTVNAITPHMPTYGMEFKRKFSAAVRTLDYCDLKTAKHIGNDEKIAKQRERAAKEAFDLMSAETLETFTPDRQAQIKERLRKHYALQGGAAAFVNDLDKTPGATDFIAYMRSEPQAPWLKKHDNGRMARMAQTLEQNEMLSDARRAMFYEDLALPTLPISTAPSHSQRALVGVA